MSPLPPRNTTNSPYARQFITNWAAIYGPHPDLLRVPPRPTLTNMRPSRSHLSLKDLPEGLENLSLDRTANSSPAAKHKKDTSLGRSVIFTPPMEEQNEPVDHIHVANREPNKITDNRIHLNPKAEDDVFGAEPRAKLTNIERAPAAGREIIEYAANNTIAPRSDRLLNPITPSNAQGVLPPDALVFVANLSVSRTEEQLEESCRQAFDQFGQCIVKVRRDKHKHPFALIQYLTTADAIRAVEQGRELVIDGRPVRTERAECRRSVVLSRIGGGAITTEEAEELLGKYGPIAQMQPTTHADGRLHGVPEGMWVKFAYYLDFKDCLKAFNHTTTLFKVQEPPNLEPRTRSTSIIGSPVVQQGLRTPRSNVDQKSIFVGNLPADATEAELREIFSNYGQIKGCNIIRKPITGGQGYNIFGFIEYASITEADAASEAELDIRGQRIRVEPKEYSARRHTRLHPFGRAPSTERAPRGIVWGPSENAYQSPGAAIPYGFQPIYLQGPTGGFSPYPSGYGWTPTPPSSAQRRRAFAGEEYFVGGSQQPQFAQMAASVFALPPYRDNEPDDQEQPLRRYR